MSNTHIKVWGSFIRIFHWSLVILFAIAYFTGEEESGLHIYSSYAIGGLISTRVLWGLIGGKYARFSEFIRPPAKVAAYIKSLMRGKPDHYLGHNPAGGYMIVALLVMLAITTMTGLKVYGIEGHGPLAENTAISFISTANADEDKIKASRKHDLDNRQDEGFNVSEKEEEFWEEIHETVANLTVLLIFLHVLGVIISSRIHKENLVWAMVTGRKKQRVLHPKVDKKLGRKRAEF
jgi:cytochrome b